MIVNMAEANYRGGPPNSTGSMRIEFLVGTGRSDAVSNGTPGEFRVRVREVSEPFKCAPVSNDKPGTFPVHYASPSQPGQESSHGLSREPKHLCEGFLTETQFESCSITGAWILIEQSEEAAGKLLHSGLGQIDSPHFAQDEIAGLAH
jgi:hypothetical protein